jgi:hypothetical protein
MSAIQGVSSTTTPVPPQVQQPSTPPVRKDKDHDGDFDKAGAVDKDKGNIVNLQA